MIAYAITDPTIYDRKAPLRDLERIARKGARWLAYRDRHCDAYSEHARLFLDTARKMSFERIVLHGDWKLAADLGADGVHLRSDQLAAIPEASAAGLFVVASTHRFDELRSAAELGADAVTLSPVFASPGKGTPLGLDRFARICAQATLPVLALGGVLSREEIEACRKAGAAGFASIRYFA